MHVFSDNLTAPFQREITRLRLQRAGENESWQSDEAFPHFGILAKSARIAKPSAVS